MQDMENSTFLALLRLIFALEWRIAPLIAMQKDWFYFGLKCGKLLHPVQASVLEHLVYRKRLITQLVGNVRNKSKHRGRPSGADAEKRLDGGSHFMA